MDDTEALAAAIRVSVLRQSLRANVGHIGSALSVADIVATLYSGILRAQSPDDPERDRFILSKGHAALALHAALHLRGWLTHAQLSSFCADGSPYGVHPEIDALGVDFATGSLGHGLSMGTGAALAARMQRSARRAFVLLSDAECNEGSVWEASMFAAHHRLSNLVAIIDLNGQQALGATNEILRITNMAERWRAFGWDAYEVDGHDHDALLSCYRALDFEHGPPHVLVAKTVFGKGVSFMEGQLNWHYYPIDQAQYERALADVEAGYPSGVR
ncbi:MAG: transketolase [Chloroflexota bacterium]